MPDQPHIVLVHGSFAESASWNPVIEQLLAEGLDVVALANPLRSVASDATYVRDVITALDERVVLVGHSYGGIVVTEAAADNDSVVGLVYVSAFAPDHGESAFELSARFPGSTLDEDLYEYPVSTGVNDLAIRQLLYPRRFAADLPIARAALMAATQRPVTQAALWEGLPTTAPAWHHVPSWFVYGDHDLIIPVALHRLMAERAGPMRTTEIAGGSHAVMASNPDAVVAAILDAVAGVGIDDEIAASLP